MNKNKMLAAALVYADYGWPVFPVHTPTGESTMPCSCRRVTCPQIGQHPCHKNTCKDRGKHPCHQTVCDSAGKHPRTKNGLRDASTDKAKIRRWWGSWKDANIGVATGKEAGVFALDVDPRGGGAESLASLETKNGELPETRTAETGGGGAHFLFKYPDFLLKDSTGLLGPGLDIKGEGGAIIVAPSLHMSGNQYRWRSDAPVSEAPQWLLRFLRLEDKSRPKKSLAIGDVIPEGRRNDTLTSLAGTMRRRGMGAEEIMAALLVTNNKRCDPPLPEDEVRKIASSVCRYEPAGEGTFR